MLFATHRDKPLVSVLIVTFNYEQYIGEAIESILAQSYPHDKIEIIIIDDGSQDNTVEVVDKYRTKSKLIYQYQEHKGKASATRRGIQLSKGKYLFNLDADDFFYSHCIATVVTAYETNDSLVQVSHLACRFEVSDNTLTDQYNNHNLVNIPVEGFEFVNRVLFHNYNIGLGSTFSGRSCILKAISIPDAVDMYIDLYLFLMVARYGTIMQLDEVLSVFRRHSNSYSEGLGAKSIERAKRYMRSAEAIYLQILGHFNDKKISEHYKYFYKLHLLAYNKTFVSIFFLSVYLMVYSVKNFWRYKDGVYLIYQTFKQVLVGYRIFFRNSFFNKRLKAV